MGDAFPVLRQWWERADSAALRRTALLAIAMLRREEAIEFLLGLVAEAPGFTARDAIAALAVYRHDEALCERLRTAAARHDADLRAALEEAGIS